MQATIDYIEQQTIMEYIIGRISRETETNTETDMETDIVMKTEMETERVKVEKGWQRGMSLD